MKKQSIIILIVVALVTLLLSAGPVLAKEKYDFTGTRTRDSGILGDSKVVNCWLIRSEQLAYWTVTTNPGPVSHLVDGEWFNYNSKLNLEVLVCVPESPPDPSDLGPADTGRGVIYGPFTLSPTGANGGIWEGEWKLLIREDDSVAMTATAEGIGGDLDGLILKVYVEQRGAVDAPFNGYILSPKKINNDNGDDDEEVVLSGWGIER